MVDWRLGASNATHAVRPTDRATNVQLRHEREAIEARNDVLWAIFFGKDMFSFEAGFVGTLPAAPFFD